MANIRVSSAIAITDLGASKPASARYVVTNEATGRHFPQTPVQLHSLRLCAAPVRSRRVLSLRVLPRLRLASC